MESEDQDHLLFFQSKLLADRAFISTACFSPPGESHIVMLSRLECHLGSLIPSPRTYWDCEARFIIEAADSKMFSDPGSSKCGLC